MFCLLFSAFPRQMLVLNRSEEAFDCDLGFVCTTIVLLSGFVCRIQVIMLVSLWWCCSRRCDGRSVCVCSFSIRVCSERIFVFLDRIAMEFLCEFRLSLGFERRNYCLMGLRKGFCYRFEFVRRWIGFKFERNLGLMNERRMNFERWILDCWRWIFWLLFPDERRMNFQIFFEFFEIWVFLFWVFFEFLSLVRRWWIFWVWGWSWWRRKMNVNVFN